MKRLMLAFVVVLPACSTVQSVSASPEDEVQLSSRNIEDVSRCLQLKYDTPQRVDADGQPQIVLKNNYGGTIALFTLTETEQGTRIALRTSSALNILGDWRSCAA